MKKVTKLLLIMLLAFTMVMSFIACDKNDEETVIDTTITLALFNAEDEEAPIDKDVLGDVEKYYVITGYTFSDNVAKIVENVAKNKNYYNEDAYIGTKDDAWKNEQKIYNAISNPTLLTEVKAGKSAPSKITIKFNDAEAKFEATEGEVTYPVLGIADSAFTGHTEIKTLTIPETYLYVGQGAFSGCSSIETYTAPFVGSAKDAVNGKKSFGYVFGTVEYTGGTSITQNYNASGTATYFVPASLKTVNVNGEISKYAFHNVTTVKEVSFTNTVVPAYAFFGCTALDTVDFATITEVNDGAFSGCTSLENVGLANVTTIGANAFENCAGIEAVTLKDEVVIGEKAFKGCTSIKEVALNNATVRASAFSGCSALETVEINGCTLSFGVFASWGDMLTIKGEGNVLADNTAVTSTNFQLVFIGAFDVANGTQKVNVNITEFNKV